MDIHVIPYQNVCFMIGSIPSWNTLGLKSKILWPSLLP